MRHLSLIRWTLCCLITLLLASSLPARTPDGIDLGNSYYYASPGYYNAVISCENGRETLDLQIDLSVELGAGWVIAVPASSQNISLTWLEKIPSFGGRSPIMRTRSQLKDLFILSRATQLYPLLYDFTFGLEPLGWTAQIPSAVPPPTHAGLTCALYSAQNRGDLERAIAQNEIELLPEEFNRLAPYIDADHTFVIIRVASASDYQRVMRPYEPNGHVPGLEIQFPSNVPLLPLYAVAKYKYNPPPSRYDVRIYGYVNLAAEMANRPELEGNYRLRYFRGTDTPGLGVRKDITYTRWQSQQRPLEVRFTPIPADTFNKVDAHLAELNNDHNYVILFLLITASCSYLSAGIAGLLVEQRLRAFRGVGLFNFGTIIALNLRLASKSWSSTGLTKTKRRRFLLTFTLTYLATNYLAAAILNHYIIS